MGNAYTVTNPYSRLILDYISQSGPQTLNMLVASIGAAIPPGEAKRTYQRRTLSSRPNAEFGARTDEDLIRAGRRDIIRNILSSFTRSGSMERIERDDGQAWFSLPKPIPTDAYSPLHALRTALNELLDDTGHATECPWRPYTTPWPECPHEHHTRERGTTGDTLRL